MIWTPIWRHLLELVGELELPDPGRRDLLAALEAQRSSALNLWHDAALDAGLSREQLKQRGAAVFLLSATCNICDDLMDGDADYVEPRNGPWTQILLHNLAHRALLQTDLDRACLGRCTDLFFQVIEAQHAELHDGEWDFDKYQWVTRGIAGLQFAIYLAILWHGTALEPHAETSGLDLGTVALAARDLQTSDPRLVGQPPQERTKSLRWASEAADRLVTSCPAGSLCRYAASMRSELGFSGEARPAESRPASS